MKLYYSDVLSARKACAVVRYLGLPVEWVYLDLGKGEQVGAEHMAVNPNAKVPTLIDGGEAIWEADAVICHLARKAGSDLWPAGQEVELIRWLSWNAQHFGRAGGALFFEHLLRPRFGLGPADPVAVEEALGDFRRYAAVLDAHLADRPWILGDTLTVADFSVGVVLPYAERAHMPLDEFPVVARWHDQLNALPAWRDPFPQGQA